MEQNTTMNSKKLFSTLTFFILQSSFFISVAQVKSLTSSEILLNLKKLNVVGTVLHIAAHPDDENTLLLSHLSKERLVRTGYLSMTRGDGGQNLIGPEQGEYVGVIRTQELMAARRIDGAEQLFSRAYDFGFSKTREETIEFWGKDQILADVVYVIRKYQPDVVITRFPPDARAGHGHHNSSAFLAEEAFKICNDPTKFPEQLKYVKVWQPKRLVWNTFAPGFQNQKPTDKGTFIPIEISGYNPYLGKSYTEIAAESRSQHKSQGFGGSANRNIRIDYLFHKDGIQATKDVFDDIDLTWNRVPNSQQVAQFIDQAIRNYNINFPASSVPVLVRIYQELNKLDPENNYVKIKKSEVETLIQNCLGLWIESNPTEAMTVAGEKTDLKLNIVKRADYPVKLTRIQFLGAKFDSTFTTDLKLNEQISLNLSTKTNKDVPTTQPYWLEKPLKARTFDIEDQTKIGLPENVPTLQTNFSFLIDGQNFTFTKPWIYKAVHPVDGESYQPFEVRPEVMANISEKVYAFADNKPKEVEVVVKGNKANVKGSVELCHPATWKVSPEKVDFELKNKGDEQHFKFMLTPPSSNEDGKVGPIVRTQSGDYARALKTVEYKHIPTQTLFPLSEAAVTKLDVKNKARNIGYIAGAGDEVPAALRQMGCQVTMLDEAELNKNLSNFDAIVVGIRAYNTEDRIAFFQEKLMEYVKAGGTMVVQYATAGGFNNNGLKVKEMGPYPFKIGRERVTEENAVMTFLQPNHPLLNSPNKITDKDFDGWIQERGIYFAQEWDKNYVPIFSSHDTNEAEKQGSLIYCQYGKGHFIYTGLVFFRELPAGVSGAYRLFANLISVGK